MNAFICTGLDGTNPLHMLTTMGAFCTLHHAGLSPRLSWTKRTQWHPVLHVTAEDSSIIQCLIAAFVTDDIAAQRTSADEAKQQWLKTESVVLLAQKTLDQHGVSSSASGKAEFRKLQAAVNEAKAQVKSAKVHYEGLLALVNDRASAKVKERHSILTLPNRPTHMADVTKGGLSASDLRSVAGRKETNTYICGLAAVFVRTEAKKTTIARSHLSFSNNNSGKELFKDFLGVAKFANTERIRDALFGPGDFIDEITGLGWDPASQRSYALQFTDPQDQVECQTMMHALAFLGLEAFPVVPYRRDRATIGVVYDRSSKDEPDADGQDEGDDDTDAPKSKRQEYMTWPLWDSPLTHPVALGLLAQAHEAQFCAARGIIALVRARRFSLNKRSYFAPGQIV